MQRILFAALLGAAFLPAPAVAQGPVAFLDVEKVILSYQATADLTQELEARLEEAKKEIRAETIAIESDLDKLQGEEELDIENREAVLARFERERSLAERKAKLEVRKERVVAQLERSLVEHMKKVYDEIRRTSEAVAREAGFQAVLQVRGKKEIEGRTRDVVKTNIVVRGVVWYDPKLDITDEVLEQLNR